MSRRGYRNNDEPDFEVRELPALPEARTWAELTTMDSFEAIDLVSDVISGRRPVRDLPDWPKAMAGDRNALDRIVRVFDTLDQLRVLFRPEPGTLSIKED